MRICLSITKISKVATAQIASSNGNDAPIFPEAKLALGLWVLYSAGGPETTRSKTFLGLQQPLPKTAVHEC